MTNIFIKRVYEPPEKKDGFRVLVDRLWPRGFSKEKLHADQWIKDVAPSADLRKWFNHEPEKWTAFKKAYKAELKKTGAMEQLITCCKKHKTVTLLYAAKDEQYNQALVLQELLMKV